MKRTQVGDRVGALLKAEAGTVWLIGYGTYQGMQVPDPALGVVLFDTPMEVPNPCIKLDSGKFVFGCECWWGPEADIQRRVAQYGKIIKVNIAAERRKAKR